jgi:excisionase family DNA binding protein
MTTPDDTSADDGWMTTVEAGRYLGVTPRRLFALIDAGELPFARFDRRTVVRRADVYELRLRLEDG